MAGRETCLHLGLVLIWNIVLNVNLIYADNVENNNRMFVLKIKQNLNQEVFRFLREYNFTHLYQITPSTHIFEYSGQQKALYTLPKFLRLCCRDKIIKVEHLREYRDTLRPVGSLTEERGITQEGDWPSSTNLVCDNYYGMGVPEAWSLGYTGRGVSVAVTDVGVNIELEDLKDNINTTLSYNFVEGNTNVTPEYFHNIRDKASTYTDHGNKVTSIIAAIKGNNLCSAGIAYNAKVTVLKIYRVKRFYKRLLGLEPSHWTRSDITSRALSYEPNNIDIFANAWAPTHNFDTLDRATREAIKDGAKNGRRGLGNIYVVPSGPPGNALSNNIYTITVNSIGRYGTVPENTNIDASVLTSGLGYGNNLTSSFMVSTTLNNACVTSFKGVSAATSQIAAVIALALEANPNLSLRDVQHLLVQASDKKGLQEEKTFKSNAAGNFFHDVFGFGLINAEKLVSLAATHQPAPRLRFKILIGSVNSTQKEHKQVHTFCYTCKKVKKRRCLATVEHVLVKMKLKSTSGDFSITLTSPSGTQSVLINHISTQKPVVVKNLNLVSVHFWGEVAFGSWKLTLSVGTASGLTEADKVSLTIYGTSNKAISKDELLYDEICDNGHSNQNEINTTTSTIVTETSSLSFKTEDNSLDLTAMKPKLVWDDYYGMGVPDAWSLGYTGHGVTIAVTDVGVNTELEDLKYNINYLLSHNFVDENEDVAPEYFHNMKDITSAYTDHGNKVTSIIAAVKGNDICGTGIAHNASIAVLKIFKVRVIYNFPTLEPSPGTRFDIIPRALSYKTNEIDIFVNAWTSTKAFEILDLITRETIRHGAENGRHGLGTIYVLPSGPPGNEMSNNIYTITVNSIGRYGTVPRYTNIDASVITCGLGDGHNLTSSTMITTTLNNACVTSFKGLSAATSQIAAIIALAIEANNNLSLRDIQHLLVHASDYKGLREEKAFRRNGAGKFFHDMFGFGLIDAGKLVKMAVKHQPLPTLLSQTLTSFVVRVQGDTQIYEFCNDFKTMVRDRRLNTVEHVLVNISFTSTSQKIRVLLTSPLGTTSLLLDYTSRQRQIDVNNVKLVSVHFWGESPFGSWSLFISDHELTKLRHASLTLYGTNNGTVSSYQDGRSVCDNK